MELALFLAQALLILVFFLAGSGKLVDLAGMRRTLSEFGVPSALVAPLSVLLPVLEVAVAIGLLSSATAWLSLMLGFTLLLLFTAAVSVNLARGQTPMCRCFGQISSKPIGWSTLVRNGLLTTIAGVTLLHGPRLAAVTDVQWLDNLSLVERAGMIVNIILLGLVAVVGWCTFHLTRQNGRLLLRLDALEAQPDLSKPGLPTGTPAPSFRLHDLFGNILTLDTLCADNRPVALIFWDPLCRPCSSLLADISRWQHEYASKLNVTLISKGQEETNRAKAEEWRVQHVLVQQDSEISEAYRVRGTPAAVIVRPDLRTGSPVVVGVEAVRILIEQFVGHLTMIKELNNG